jgi:amino acid adenylation domain-containing protein
MDLSNSNLLTLEPEEDVFVFPVSFAQQRLWFLDQFEPGSPFYNIPTAVRLTGRMEVDVLTRSLNEIIRRHEALRTTFSTIDGQPVQIIHPGLVISVPVVDLRHLPIGDRAAESLRLANVEARGPFDLSTGPLIRVTLLLLGDEDYIVLLTMHHIISDGWSMGVFIYELTMLYEAYVTAKPSPLPELAIQYADFSEWQREWLQGDVLEGQVNYWLQQLGGKVPVLELPTDRSRPPVLTSRGASYSATFPKHLTDSIKVFSQQNGATMFMTLLAAFQALLYRYTGQLDITIGSPIANRNRGELESLIGVFINTVVFRTNLSGEPTFRRLLERVREVTLGAYANQDVPFEAIVDRLGLPRDMSHTPLFQVMFILQNAPVRARQLPGLMMEPVEVHSGTSIFDITLVMGEMTDGLSVSVEYNTDLFNPDTIQRMVAHLQTLLESATQNPDQSIAFLPILPEAERRQILFNWNETGDNFSSSEFREVDRQNLCVHQLFELQAKRTPDSLAVVLPGLDTSNPSNKSIHRLAQLTYQELNENANRLANYLSTFKIRRDQVVGVFMERSTEMIVALLGILKAGGAYLPLDPFAPQDRLAFILGDAVQLSPNNIPIILTQAHLTSRLPDVAAQVIPIDPLGHIKTEWSKTLENSAEHATGHAPDQVEPYPSQSEAKPDDLVYLTYTSGSTGQSKGVMVEHRSLVNAYLGWEKAYRLEPGASHLQMANFTFDVFSGDLVRALCSGGKLVLCPREWLLDPERLYALMAAERIDVAEFVPAVLRTLVQYLEKTDVDVEHQRLDFMSLLACGSDSWYVGEYQKFLRFLGKETRLINSFGLTETTIDSTYFEGMIDHLSPDQLVPIGRPFANTRLYILDTYLQPRPIGIPGELFIGGPGLARGYHNRTDLNQERFISIEHNRSNLSVGQNLETAVTKERLYRTGDLARYLPDGNVEFLGRLDDQLKIRGFRIEPGEIEAVLGSHPGIKEVTVVAVEVASDDKRLVAYLVPVHAHAAPTAGELRRHVQQQLPDYMVPAAFVMIDATPLSPNGKVDRRALSEMHGIDWSERQLANEFVSPRTPLEELLADIWTQVLGVHQVGVYDNFFELGGHSLLATQLISRVRETFLVDLPLRNLFESPTIATLADNIAAAQHKASGVIIPPLDSLPRDAQLGLPIEPVPLSFAQQRLWFLDQLEPNSPFYNLPEAVRLTGQLDESILEDCLNEVITRHESLRTTFQIANGKPVQRITPLTDTKRLEMVKTDLRHLEVAAREEKALQIAREEAQTPFNLATGPLLRARLLRLGDQETIVLLTMHHIVGDNWSTNILIQELAVLYDAFINSRLSPLSKLDIQYADYSAWQRQWLQGQVLQNQIDYWKQQLKGLPPVLELPTDRPRPAMQTFSGDYRTFILSPELSQKIRTTSQAEGVTLFMTLLAAFNVLLYRYTGQEDLSIGTPIANRTRAEVEGLIGFFVNTLVLRTDLSGSPNFRELVKRVREMALAAYTHQDVPFEMVVDALQPERNLSHSPLFQVMFSMQNAPRTAVTLPGSGLRLGPVDVHSGTAKFDLTLFMVDDGERVSGAMEFNTDLFDALTIEKMLEHFEILLGSMLENPTQSVELLPILSEAERQHILIEWNQTAASFPKDQCVHQLFESQVKRTPDARALAFTNVGGENPQVFSWTYTELNQRANRLAHYLQKLGVGPDTLVGLCVERSLEMVVGLLAVLKAGGAYVPLDPTYPNERLAFMLADSQAAVLLTQQHLLTGLLGQVQPAGKESARSALDLDAQGHDAMRTPVVICLDTDWNLVEAEDGENPGSSTNPENLAYVIYTSGSTGLPKGAMILHRGLVNYLTWCLHAYPLELGQGSPVHSSISFDLTVTSLLAPLISGRTASLLPEGLGVELLGETLKREAQSNAQPFSLIKITPAHLQLLGEQLKPQEAMDRTRSFIIGGENLTIDHIRKWLEFSPQTELVNEYGPTETVVGCCVYWTPQLGTPQSDTTGYQAAQLLEKFRTGVIPIGRPIINTQLYILDGNQQPVPVGVPGELYIGGAGVARGYLNRPELSAEKFVSNPFAELNRQFDPGGEKIYTSDKLYRTGDLARYLPDGNIECLGRIDFQVKIRGFRVELGEIENVLNQHPAIHEAIVWVWEEAGFKNLVAYLVLENTQIEPAQASRLSPADTLIPDLRRYLQGKLPDYMVPAAYVFLDEMPLTVNGKVDRKALPKPELSHKESQVDYVLPRSPQEEIIAGILSEILGVAKVGVYDNFFDLGGHSLLATQVVSRLRDAFQVELPLRSLFEAPTVAGLAGQVEIARRNALGIQMPGIQSIPRDPQTGLPTHPVALSFSQQRLWVLDQLLPGTPLYNIPTFMQVDGPFDVVALEFSLNKVIERHEILRTIFTQVDGRPAQVVLPELKLSIPQVDLRSVPHAERQAKANQAARQVALNPFDLAKGPLIRLSLIRLEDEQYYILLNTHHIISDDWSLSIFIREILGYYGAFTTSLSSIELGRKPNKIVEALFPKLSLQYVDFAAWQRDWLQGEVLNSQLDYWKKQLSGIPPLLALPIDRPRPAVQTFNGAQVVFELTPDQLTGLKAISRQEGATLFMALMAAFQVLLSRYTGQEDISVGTPIANRTRSDIESLIGFFVNTLVMRGDLAGNPDFRTLLKRVRETALGAYAHQDIPFEMLVDALNPQRDMSYHPLFQVMFVHQNAPRQIQTGSQELALKPVDMHEGIARFDLTLTMIEVPQGESVGLSGAIEYNTDLFDQATIERMIRHFKVLIDGILANPEQPVGYLPMLTAEERRTILEEWNHTDGEPVDWRCVHELFEDIVKSAPDAPAVVYTDDNETICLNYAELNHKANQLANYLHGCGVAPETLVGICVKRSIEMLVGILGVLKAGGAYLPMDPTYPQDRLAYMLSDSGIRILLTQEKLVDHLPKPAEKEGYEEILLDRDWVMIEKERGDLPLDCSVGLDNLAYMIYTSGSTGRPKGVLLKHRGMTNFVQAYKKRVGFDAHSRTLQFASFSFDGSIFEIFTSLVSGGCLVLTAQETLTSVPDLLKVMLDQSVTTATFPPSLLRVLDPLLVSQALPAFKTLISAGESCPREVGARWAIDRQMFNGYGPTETTVGATIYEVQAQKKADNQDAELIGVLESASTVPIGRPIQNMEIYLLDANRQLIPVGVPGEIYLGGIGLARGYLNMPELTDEKFVDHPFRPGAAVRLYRTGDLGRFLPDGNIEFMGRVDFQVKVRGFRIELGEIESLLNQHPAVQTAVVIVREDRPGDKRLVAYLLAQANTGPENLATDQLRSYLRQNLPEFMLPTAFIWIDSLPLTPNGKVDRRVLPAPEQSFAMTTPYAAPSTAKEQLLANLWAEVIGFKPSDDRPTIGVQDNFFELGGDSILSIQVIARANQAGLSLTPRQLFEHPTIAGLASVAMEVQAAEPGSLPIEAQPDESGKVTEKELSDFGWSEDDLEDILGAIETNFGEDDS